MQYSISDLSKKTGLSTHTLRFYEKEGLIRHVERTPSMRRIYGDKSLGCLIAVICLKEAGFALPQIKHFFDLTLQGEESLPARLDLLHSAKDTLTTQRDNLNRSIEFVDLIIAYGEDARKAISKGASIEKDFPFLTLLGMSDLPYVKMNNGKLKPFNPEDKSSNSNPNKAQL